MKTAEEWFKKWFDQEEKVSPNIADINAVKADVLRHAARGLNQVCCNSECCAVAISQARKVIEAEADKLREAK